ncbi:MAG: M1 family metallopeptidase [Candidatus Obscuribacterales bacterium]|nr:M1 family metallopeptidase [Candidatus Obscuribacterales bacterium]
MTSSQTKMKVAAADAARFRLPLNVSPVRYVVEWQPDLETNTFAGFETIHLDIKEATKDVVLNCKEMEIQEATITSTTGDSHKGTVTLEEETEFARIAFSKELKSGSWQLSLRFTGILNDRLAGFYRSKFKDNDGKEHKIATTQFESTDARAAFPCFDEPAMKATYKLSFVVPEELEVVSNGHIENQKSLDGSSKGLKRVEFSETMKMSTYLVAFCIGKFVKADSVKVGDVELKFWCTPGKEKLVQFAMDKGAFALKFFQDFFEIKYPGGNKIDFVAIPDFAAGAMENLGAIFFRESDLLVNPDTATHGELVRVCKVVQHELAHMWFGDLVTMDWWTWLWLNESFATFMETLCGSEQHPEWNVWDGFGISRAAAMRIDSLGSTHPIETPVFHPDDTAELFDVISYQKGCSVLYMIFNYIGRDLFQAGVAKYLKDFSYSTAEGHHLWDSLQAACEKAGADLPVREIMDTWILTAGHPLVSVSESEKKGSIKISQRDFKFLPNEVTGQIRPIPLQLRIKFADGKIETKTVLLKEKEQDLNLGKDFEYVVVNADGSGFYRVVYAPELLSKLTAQAQTNLSVIERFNLINDTWSSVRAGLVSATDYLELVKVFGNETDPNVWAIILGSLSALHSLLSTEQQKVFAKMMRELLAPTHKRLGWAPISGEDIQTKELRGSMIGALGTLGEDETVRAKAKELFAAWQKDKSTLDSNVLPAVVSTLAYTGDAKRFDEFFALFQAAKDKNPQDEARFRQSLAGFQEPVLYDKAIKLALSEEIRSQDAPSFFATILMSSNPHKAKAAWNYMTTNWDAMVSKYPTSGMVRMAAAVTGLDTPELQKEVEAFYATHEVKSGNMAISQALEQLRINVSLRERETQKLIAHLTKTTKK